MTSAIANAQTLMILIPSVIFVGIVVGATVLYHFDLL